MKKTGYKTAILIVLAVLVLGGHALAPRGGPAAGPRGGPGPGIEMRRCSWARKQKAIWEIPTECCLFYRLLLARDFEGIVL